MFYRTLIFVCALSAAGHGSEAPTLLDEGYGHMYNLQFSEAHRAFREWSRLRPNDPMGPVSDAAAYLFSEFDRLHILQSEFFVHDKHFITDHALVPDPVLKKNFENALAAARKLGEAAPPNDSNTQFASILLNGLASDYAALIEKRYVASFRQMGSARGTAERLLASHPEYYDAWVAIGIENYVLSAKPAPLRWFLRVTGAQTDRAVAIRTLKIAAEKGRYLKPLARLLLAVTALRDEDTGRARELLSQLASDYPHNPLYAQELARLTPLASKGMPK